MEFYELHPVDPQKRFIDKAVEVLRSGGVIIYPTDTVYGIACDIFHKEAIENIFRIKNEADDKLFSFVCADLKDISKYAKVSDHAYKVMKKLLPGPYTFVLSAAREVPKKLWTKRNTVGIRIPDHKVPLMLTKELGNPIASISVTNRLGEIMSDPNEIKASFNNQVDIILSVGALATVPSTVVDLSGDEPEIIREGAGDISLFM